MQYLFRNPTLSPLSAPHPPPPPAPRARPLPAAARTSHGAPLRTRAAAPGVGRCRPAPATGRGRDAVPPPLPRRGRRPAYTAAAAVTNGGAGTLNSTGDGVDEAYRVGHARDVRERPVEAVLGVQAEVDGDEEVPAAGRGAAPRSPTRAPPTRLGPRGQGAEAPRHHLPPAVLLHRLHRSLQRSAAMVRRRRFSLTGTAVVVVSARAAALISGGVRSSV